MRFYRQVIFCLIMFATVGVGFEVSVAQVVERVGLVENNRARLDQLRAKGYEALYNLDYEGARRLFKEMTQLFPDHPAGPQCLAATIWLEELNRSRHLQASLYSSESLYSRNDKVDPLTVEHFRDWTRKAKLLSEARLRRNPKDVEALYFLGATDGLKAVFTAAVEGRYRAALVESSRAVERHKEVLKIDPDLHDAELTIGMSNYIVGSLPLPLKVLASIGGVRGSKKRGLEMLERVARDGHWARDIARTLLIDLYKREKRWPEALTLTRELAAKYPRNYLFHLQAADAIVAQATTMQQKEGPASASEAKAREAFSIFEALLHDRTPQNDAAKRAADLIHFRYGVVLLMVGEPERAIDEFSSAATLAGADSSLATMARLRRAQSMDLAGKRREALTEYQAVLKRPNVYHSHDEARRGLKAQLRKLSDIR
jgi:tetratricopeptide (TPR) repeat protein